MSGSSEQEHLILVIEHHGGYARLYPVGPRERRALPHTNRHFWIEEKRKIRDNGIWGAKVVDRRKPHGCL
jgi:hypothetical protein